MWAGNAEELIESGTAQLKECVCCRDDIMNYLVAKGVEPKMAFVTMESVRKGKGLNPAMEEAMVTHQVAKWFIDSCKKIKYMFPKGHAVAYVTMAMRIAWFKVYQPLAYYAAYFTIRGKKGFDAAAMLVDAAVLREQIIRQEEGDEEGSAEDTAKAKEALGVKRMVLEMMMRGIRFLPIDLYKSDAVDFLIEDGCLRLPFASMGGLGDAAAQTIVAKRDRPFLSVEDLKKRTKISSSVIAQLRSCGALENLSETSQTSMF